MIKPTGTPYAVLAEFYKAEAAYMSGHNDEFVGMRKTLSSDVVLRQSPELPFGGEYIGHSGYETWAGKMRALFDRLAVTEQEVFERGDTVVVCCRFRTRSRLNGSTQDFPMVQVVTVKNGTIVDFRPFYWNIPAYVAAAEPRTPRSGKSNA